MNEITPNFILIEEESPSHSDRLRRLETLADWMDSRFVVPGTEYRFGLDPLLGLLPGIGDTASFLISAYIVMEAQKLGGSKALKYRMIWNIFLDLLVGSIPIAGDLFDAGFKANRKNIALLRAHLARNPL